MLKEKKGYSLIAIALVIAIQIFQIGILPIEDNLYWKLYNTSNDLALLFLATALFSDVSYTKVIHKALAGAMAFWFLAVSVYNAINDYDVLNVF